MRGALGRGDERWDDSGEGRGGREEGRGCRNCVGGGGKRVKEQGFG